MNGPQHYREAELLQSGAVDAAEIGEHDEAILLIMRAQVHATLALAAATALNDGEQGLTDCDYTEWRSVASAVAS